ncbi:PRD domain-containing protein [Clostridium polynesiense]|uniref:PRD domain-containing protein n=1 Tax=Clostridium polynesiense TaxID=1325933 RepID=UPI00058D42D1|nr:PRD domain-containing protein [Clostridium polynesiense]
MKLSKDIVLEYMQSQAQNHQEDIHFTTQQLSESLQMQRSNLSRILNELVKDQLIKKTAGRPVYYSLVKKEEDSCFKKMIGYKTSLKQVVQLTKAALLYPENSLPILITGQDGSGKSLLASLIYEFTKENHIISTDAPFVKINCRYLEEESKDKIKDIFFAKGTGAMFRAQKGVLFVDHINYLPLDMQNDLLKQAESAQSSSLHTVLIYSVDDSINPSQLSLYTSRFSIVVDLPPLSKRTLEERLEMVQQFFQKEALRMQKNIKINAELLRCLLLYPCQSNVKQLKKDIQLGCANGYARNFDADVEQMEVFLHDFPNYVRKGFLSYRKYRTQIESIIPENYQYIFSSETTNVSEDSRLAPKNARDTLYDMIDRKVEELKEHGIEEEDITTIIHEDLDQYFYKINQQIAKKEIDKESISKIVDPQIISSVDSFLKEASLNFDRVYPDSIFYAICLHLSAMLERQSKSQKISNEQIVKIIKEFNKEYIFCSKFASELENKFNLPLPIDEVVFLTMFICQDTLKNTANKPVVLVAMHGNSTASSIVEVVDTLVKEGNIFSFDLMLDKDMQFIYEELKQTILEIDQGKGILLLYDMGSILSMATMIAAETGIEIKAVCIPATLIALDCSRKASCNNSLEEVYNEAINSYQAMYPELMESYQKQGQSQVIITLCMTGEGAAIQMKNYISQNIHLENTDIIPLAISDREYLLKKVNQIQKNQKIVCVIGAYDPELYGIPYIPISTLFDTPSDKLDILLSLETTQAVMSVNYDAVYAYLQEQLEGFDVQLLKEVLPKAIIRIKKAVHGLSSDQEIGLFMHIACSIYRMQNQQFRPRNEQSNRIISKNKRLYNDLKDILAKAEDEFYVKFNDDEYANIIQIIKQC